jgi:cyclophilin family peptidyl-prolyl cis-trans isomerase
MSHKITSTLLFLGFLFSFSLIGTAKEGNPIVIMKTTKGDITIELDAEKAPITVKNFLSYVDEKFYDGTIFHRVIKGFMIQGGGLTDDLTEKEGKDFIKNEAANGLKNLRGTISMARMGEPHTASAQFFINHVDNAFLDHQNTTTEGYGYCVFGRVIKGIEVVDKIANARTTRKSGMENVPRETIVILSIRRQ